MINKEVEFYETHLNKQIQKGTLLEFSTEGDENEFYPVGIIMKQDGNLVSVYVSYIKIL